MAVTDDAAFVDQHDRRPSAGAVTIPVVKLIVLHDRKLDCQFFGCCFYLSQRLFPEEFRRMNADDGQAGTFVGIVPGPQLRDDIAAVDSTVRPEFNQHNPAPFKPAMVNGLLLSQCSPVISGAALPSVIAEPSYGLMLQATAATPIKNQKATGLDMLTAFQQQLRGIPSWFGSKTRQPGQKFPKNMNEKRRGSRDAPPVRRLTRRFSECVGKGILDFRNWYRDPAGSRSS